MRDAFEHLCHLADSEFLQDEDVKAIRWAIAGLDEHYVTSESRDMDSMTWDDAAIEKHEFDKQFIRDVIKECESST